MHAARLTSRPRTRDLDAGYASLSRGRPDVSARAESVLSSSLSDPAPIRSLARCVLPPRVRPSNPSVYRPNLRVLHPDSVPTPAMKILSPGASLTALTHSKAWRRLSAWTAANRSSSEFNIRISRTFRPMRTRHWMSCTAVPGSTCRSCTVPMPLTARHDASYVNPPPDASRYRARDSSGIKTAARLPCLVMRKWGCSITASSMNLLRARRIFVSDLVAIRGVPAQFGFWCGGSSRLSQRLEPPVGPVRLSQRSGPVG